MFSGLAASVGAATAATSANIASDQAAAAATVAGAATTLSTAGSAATAVAAGLAQARATFLHGFTLAGRSPQTFVLKWLAQQLLSKQVGA